MSKFTIGIVAVLVIAIGGMLWSSQLQESDPDVISTNGIHWHPTLAIHVDGEPVEIPGNVGLIGEHAPIHTHVEDAGTELAALVEAGHRPLHLEFNDRVTKEDLKLKNFFETWGKTFTSECVLDSCGGEITMLVNGEENTEYGEYVLSEGDTIEIFYESETE